MDEHADMESAPDVPLSNRKQTQAAIPDRLKTT